MYSSNEIFTYIKERPCIMTQSAANREKGMTALGKMIKQETGDDGGGWTF